MTKDKASSSISDIMARNQREISVSEFFLKNRHLLGFDSPRKALLTAVKEAVDNSLDACDEAGILPEISVEIRQNSAKRFRVTVLDNGPGIVRAQVPKIFAKLLYGSKFHRLRMSRGQQGIGISAAGMYGQLTTGTSTMIRSKINKGKAAHHIEVQMDTRANKPAILKDEELEWHPVFYPSDRDGKPESLIEYPHGTCVSMEMEAAYVRGKLSVDEYLKQCAIINPHLQLHYRIILAQNAENGNGPDGENNTGETPWITFKRGSGKLPQQPSEIKPHPHGVELGMLMQMLKDSSSKTIKAALSHDFSRVSDRAAQEICERSGLNPKARPAQVALREAESLFTAIGATKLMRPPTDCLAPIGEEQIVAGLQKEIQAEFFTSITRGPEVYRGNPFQIEAGIAYARPGNNEDLKAEEPVRLMRFANKVPLLHMSGACAITKAMTAVNWKNYGISQPRGAMPLGPMVVMVHMASVWVPFTSESKEAIAHYPEIIREMTFALQECGRRLSVFLSRRRRQAEHERKRNYIVLYLPHLALGLKQILKLDDGEEKSVISKLEGMLERTHLEL